MAGSGLHTQAKGGGMKTDLIIVGMFVAFVIFAMVDAIRNGQVGL